MKIGNKFNGFNIIRRIFIGKGSQLLDSSVKNNWTKNQIRPLQDTFTSTKEMFAYAKERCIVDLSRKRPREHALVLDLKENKVLAEYVGNAHSCSLKNILSLPIDSKNTAIFHGHLNNMPISRTDVHFLLNNEVNQVVAINNNGEFSIVEKTVSSKSKTEIENAYKQYEQKCDELSEVYDDTAIQRVIYRIQKHGLLKDKSENMGLRYVTNYSIFKH